MPADFGGDPTMMCRRCAMKSNIQNRDGIARTLDWLDQLREDGRDKSEFGSADDPASSAGRPAEAAAQPTALAAARPTADPSLGATAAPASPASDRAEIWPSPEIAAPASPASDRAEIWPSPEIAAPASPASDRAQIYASPEIPERAPIGDELRIPIAWCEMDSCILHYAHPAALGEADIRSRAIAAGWRIDGLGRLACPKCQQGPSFWTTQRVTLWDRKRAVAIASRMAAAAREAEAAGPVGGRAAGIPATEQPLVPLPSPGWNRECLGHTGHGYSGRAC
jgi:hypothetical protein